MYPESDANIVAKEMRMGASCTKVAHGLAWKVTIPSLTTLDNGTHHAKADHCLV